MPECYILMNYLKKNSARPCFRQWCGTSASGDASIFQGLQLSLPASEQTCKAQRCCRQPQKLPLQIRLLVWLVDYSAHSISLWIFMGSRRSLASWDPFINPLQLGRVGPGRVLQQVYCVCTPTAPRLKFSLPIFFKSYIWLQLMCPRGVQWS